MKSRWILIALVAMAAMLFSACTAAPAAPAAEGEAAAPAEAGEAVTLDTVFSTEPPSLDPSLGSDTQSVWAVRQMFMGLTGFNEAAEVVPSLATEWSVSEDGLTWTYKMRDDVNWVKRDADTGEFEDLGPVTAGDVVFAVGRTLDPVEASPYASMLYMIEGAEEFNAADPAAENFEEMRRCGCDGARRHDRRIQAEETHRLLPCHHRPVDHLPAVCAGSRRACRAVDRAGNIVTNGPYTLETWQHGAYIRYVKNPLWFDAENVQIEVIQGPIIESESTAMSMYEANEIDMMADPGWGRRCPTWIASRLTLR